MKIPNNSMYTTEPHIEYPYETYEEYLVDKYESEIQYHEEQDIDTTFSDYEKEYLNALIEHEPEGDYED